MVMCVNHKKETRNQKQLTMRWNLVWVPRDSFCSSSVLCIQYSCPCIFLRTGWYNGDQKFQSLPKFILLATMSIYNFNYQDVSTDFYQKVHYNKTQQKTTHWACPGPVHSPGGEEGNEELRVAPWRKRKWCVKRIL